MSESVFNSIFETELRVLLLLSVARKKAYAVERVVALDFIICYAERFQMPYLNPHGDNQFMYAELTGRRERIVEAIKHLVTQGLLEVTIDHGYTFSISETGSAYVRKLKSEYSKQYKAIAKDAIRQFKGYSDLQLDQMLYEKSTQPVKGGR